MKRFELDFEPVSNQPHPRHLVKKTKPNCMEWESKHYKEFLGYGQHAGGGWSEEVAIIDWDELNNAELVSEVHVKTFKYKEVKPVKYEGFWGPFPAK